MAKGGGLTSEIIFRCLVVLLAVGFVIQLALVFRHEQMLNGPSDAKGGEMRSNSLISGKGIEDSRKVQEIEKPPHFFPILEPLPALKIFEDTDGLEEKTLDGSHPTIAGVTIVLQKFLSALYESNNKLAETPGVTNEMVVPAYLKLVEEYLLPFDSQYRGRSIFPVRNDGSVFISAAAFRDHLFGETLKDAFRHAKNPDKLFIGAVVQNCFGIEYTCRTGVEVVGKDPRTGRDQTKISDAPPDVNGVEQFCTDPEFKKYCDSGQIRALYVNEGDATGPAVARYFASKLWGGETYFIQVDAHLQFAQDWDERYITEIKAAKSYPKSILSSYPPGFGVGEVGESVGTRLCTCTFSQSDVEHDIIRINTGQSYKGGEKVPTQIAFIAAGFFMARAEFLTDVPFDPLLPWCFMGEEIALSMRAWTAGWDIYAPRRNLIAHQYRPGRMGLPKFWESVGRRFKRPNISNNMQSITINRVKHMVGYPDKTSEALQRGDYGYLLKDVEYYGMGTVRDRKDYIELTNIDFEGKRCKIMKWCNQGTME